MDIQEGIIKKIAIYCVSYHSDNERDLYLAAIERATRKAGDKVSVDTFVANNTDEDNPGYFGAVRRLMQEHDPAAYDYCIISNVDLTMEEDFLAKLAGYECAEDTGWIAPRIWSQQEDRDLNPKIAYRYSLKKLWLLKTMHRFPLLHHLYSKTFYHRKRSQPHDIGHIYAGHGSFIILTKTFLLKNRIIDYPVFLFCEEIYLAELCREAGLRVVYAPELNISDNEHISTGKMPVKTYSRLNYKAVRYILQRFYTMTALLMAVGFHYVNAQSLQTISQLGLPVVIIETNNGEEPTCEYVSAPEGCMGFGITNATKVPGRVSVWQNDSCLFDSGGYSSGESGMTIKIRGNTSAYEEKKPFKIKLQQQGDMLCRGDEKKYRDKDWLLLTDHQGTLNTLLGSIVSRITGVQWTPAFEYVNVFFNSQYRGVYLLSESVKRNPSCRISVDKTGFIMEYDAYWWNEDYYIPSIFYPESYTFKYPEDTVRLDLIKDTVIEMEESVSLGTYEQYFDLQSLASWVLAHDILGTYDAGGSNIFLTKYDNTHDSKIKMGPLWDFDTIMDDRRLDDWSSIHQWKAFLIRDLFNNTNKTPFVEAYGNLWKDIAPTLMTAISDSLLSFAHSQKGEALDWSLDYDMGKWGKEHLPVPDEVGKIIEWLGQHMIFLDERINRLCKTAISSPPISPIEEKAFYTLDGYRTDAVKHGIYIVKTSKGYRKVIK